MIGQCKAKNNKTKAQFKCALKSINKLTELCVLAYLFTSDHLKMHTHRSKRIANSTKSATLNQFNNINMHVKR